MSGSISPANTSAFADGAVTQPNPLGQLSTLQGILNAQQTNKLTQQQTTNAAIEGQQKQQELGKSYNSALATQFFGVNSLKDPEVIPWAKMTLDKVHSSIGDDLYNTGMQLVNAGDITGIRRLANLGIIAHTASTNPTEAVKMVYGSPYVMDDNNVKQPGVMGSPLSERQTPFAFAPAGGATKLQIDPNTQSAFEVFEDTDPLSPTFGQKKAMTHAQALAATGAWKLLPGGAPGISGAPAPAGGATSPASGAPSPASGATSPASGAPPPAGGTTPPPGAGTGYGTPFTTSQVPGTEKDWEQSKNQYRADADLATKFPQDTQSLYQALDLLKTNTTGQTPEFFNKIRGTLASALTYLGANPDDFKSIASAQDLQKVLQKMVNDQGMAQGSDARLAAALSGNPGMHLVNLANTNMIQAMVAMKRMETAMHLGYQGDQRYYTTAKKQLATTLDPRAFALDFMDQPKRDKLMASLKTQDDKDRFERSLDLAHKFPQLFAKPSLISGE